MSYSQFFSWLFVICSIFKLTAFDWYGNDSSTLAIIAHPVVDLYINQCTPRQQPAQNDQKSPHCTCERIHQGLFNEVVRILQEKNNMVQISIDDAIYGFDPKTGLPHNTFWTPKENVIYMNDVDEHNAQAFPQPNRNSSNVVVLTLPWNGYSVATRFVSDNRDADADDEYAAKRYNPQKQCTETLYRTRHI